ncbi:MAG: PDZ domain-containing protein [Chitinophagia bacterium]|nr:PDZ domain-containing protein [Chitinophagia bacterium]
MKKLLVSFVFIFLLMACKKDVTVSNSGNASEDVNTWIYNTMSYYYLWNTNMPKISATNLKDNPMNYFYSILYDYGNTDRFSWIDSSASNLANQLNGINTVLGIKYSIFYTDNTQANMAFVIAYVLKGSPAEKAGLKRGDIILKVDDKTITPSNYATILQNETLKLGLGSYAAGIFTSTGTSTSLTKVELQTNPILKDTIIKWGGKKVGYIAYIQFLSSFDDSLRNVFGRFKSGGVNELVIDLRYNGGGYVSSSGTVMNKKVYNATYTEELNKSSGSSAFNTNFKLESNNLGTLTRVFFLVSNNSASASELVINNLKPFMDVILVGEHTYGKNVGSFTLTDSKNRWNYGLQPITFKIANAKDESNYGTKDGFLPNIAITDNVLPYKQLGDPYETVLNKALLYISPVAFQPFSASGNTSQTKATLFQNKAVSDNIKMDRQDMWMKPNL